MPNDLEASIVRLPGHLHAKIKATAKADRRSMNKEIVARLEKSFGLDRLNDAENSIIAPLLQEIERLQKKIKAYQCVFKSVAR